MALVAPVVLLGTLEGLLRLAGFGYSTSFFQRSEVQGQAVWIENRAFTRRFFPPGLTRSPEPIQVPVDKGSNTFRIVVLGESAALGDPAPQYGFARQLEVLLQHRFPQRRIEVVNLGITAINSHVIRYIAQEACKLEADCWVVYMGNNEVVGPYGAGTVFGAQTPSLFFIRTSLALRATRLGQAIEAILRALARQRKQPAEWGGMEMFLEQQVRATDPRLQRVYQHFAANLEDILAAGRRARARLVLCTVVGNLKDCPPFSSLHRPNLSASDKERWELLYQQAQALQRSNQLAAAVATYQQAAALDDQFAELHFRLAQALRAAGRVAEARTEFIRARDLDTLRFRPDTQLNQVIRQAAARWTNHGLVFVDAERRFEDRSPDGLIGEAFLWEHVHFNFAGNYLLARTLAKQIAPMLEEPATRAHRDTGTWLDEETCAKRLAYTRLDRIAILEEMLKRLDLPPFTGQLDHKQRMAALRQQLRALRTVDPAALQAEAIQTYMEALRQRPDDWRLHEGLAKILEDAGRPEEAARHWRKITEQIPHYADAWHSLGNALDASGNSEEAVACFRRALALRPESIEARNGLGLALVNLGRLDQAIREYREALRRKPDFHAARVNLAQALAKEGHIEEAKAEYLRVLESDPNHVAALVNLGKLWAAEKQLDKALPLYRKATTVAPDNAIAHHNLANALLQTGQRDQAIEHFQAAVRLKPDFVEARYNLGLELAARGQTDQALEQFAEVVRLRPDFVPGRINYGVALAKARRFAEAVAQFEAALRYDPSNQAARRFLEQARSLASGVPQP